MYKERKRIKIFNRTFLIVERLQKMCASNLWKLMKPFFFFDQRKRIKRKKKKENVSEEVREIEKPLWLKKERKRMIRFSRREKEIVCR